MSSAERPELTPVAPPKTSRRNRWRSVGVLVVLAAAILVLLSQGILHSLNYFETVDQALAQRATLGTRVFRIEGVVQPGSITRTAQGASFVITGTKGREVDVDAHGSPPQLFQADIPVVVVGHFESPTSLEFYGTQILVKHTASYIAAHPARVKAPNGSVR